MGGGGWSDFGIKNNYINGSYECRCWRMQYSALKQTKTRTPDVLEFSEFYRIVKLVRSKISLSKVILAERLDIRNWSRQRDDALGSTP